jgi:hypothetical protein
METSLNQEKNMTGTHESLMSVELAADTVNGP